MRSRQRGGAGGGGAGGGGGGGGGGAAALDPGSRRSSFDFFFASISGAPGHPSQNQSPSGTASMPRHRKCPPLGHPSHSTNAASSSVRPQTRHGVSSGGGAWAVVVAAAPLGGGGGRSIQPWGRVVRSLAASASESGAGMSRATTNPGPMCSYGFGSHGALRQLSPTWWYGSTDSARRSRSSISRTNGSGSVWMARQRACGSRG